MPNVQFWARESSGISQLDSVSVRRLVQAGLRQSDKEAFKKYVEGFHLWGFIECTEVADEGLPIFLCVGYDPKTDTKRRVIVVIDQFNSGHNAETAVNYARGKWSYPVLLYRPVSKWYSIEIDKQIYPILSMCYESDGD